MVYIVAERVLGGSACMVLWTLDRSYAVRIADLRTDVCVTGMVYQCADSGAIEEVHEGRKVVRPRNERL